MKSAFFILLTVFAVSCGKFPANPDYNSSKEETVFIAHQSTDYVAIDPPFEGSVATKVNVLSFTLKVENCRPVAVEFCGRVVMEGDTEDQEHSLQFRTDTVEMDAPVMGYIFNTLERIDPGLNYTLIRPKLPTNEFSPFVGNQGRVKSLTINEAWVIDGDGKKYSATLKDSM